MKKAFILIALFALTASLQAQTAHYITSFESKYLRTNQIYDIVQDYRNNMLFASNQGVIFFDSQKWSFLDIKAVALKLISDRETQRTFLASNKGVGIVIFDKGQYSYQQLLFFDTLENNFVGGVETSDKVFFAYPDLIISIDKKSADTKVYYPIYKVDGITVVDDQALFFESGKGFHDINDNLVIKFEAKGSVLFSANFDRTAAIGFSNNKIYQIIGNNIRPLKTDAQDYINKYKLTYGIATDNNHLAVSTLTGGIIVLDINNGKTIDIINNLNGLPDVEIFAMCNDINQGLWVVHSFGASRIDMKLPVEVYSSYVGLNGYITDVYQRDTMVLVGTTEGLYYLTHPSNKELTEIIYRKKTQTGKITKGLNETKEDDVNILKRWASIFKKKDKKEQTAVKQKPKTTTKLVKETVIKDKALFYQNKYTYVYKKINGVSGKVKKIIQTPQRLYVITNKSLYEITDYEAQRIATFSYISDVDNYKDTLIVGSDKGIYSIYIDKNKRGKEVTHKKLLISSRKINAPVISIVADKNDIWIGSIGKVIYLKKKGDKITNSKIIEIDKQNFIKVYGSKIGGRLYFWTNKGIYKPINNTLELLVEFDNVVLGGINHMGVWYQTSKWNYIGPYDFDSLTVLTKLFDDIRKISTNGNKIFIITSNDLYCINATQKKLPGYNFKLSSVKASVDTIVFPGNKFEINYSDIGKLKIEVLAPCYLKKNSTEYRIGIKHKKDIIWSDWKNFNEFTPPLTAGNNELIIQAKNILGQRSNNLTYRINAKPPFTQTIWFYLLLLVGVSLLVTIYFIIRQRRLKAQNELLERMVKERTAQIEAQNKELQRQKQELEKQHKIVIEQNEKIKAQRDKIALQLEEISKLHKAQTDSIIYARRIQQALMPEHRELVQYFNDYFLVYIPRDVVSGDFYWFKKVQNKLIITVADCTGHGVPGAFLTMLGIAFLKEVIEEKKQLDPAHILNSLRDRFISALNEEKDMNDPEAMRDGMDMSLAVIDFDEKTMSFAGAYNPVYIIRNQELYELEADKMPVGMYFRAMKPFSTKIFNLQKQDKIYFFSDGLIDQLGGKSYKKFRKGNFKKLLISIADLPMDTQKKLIEETFITWKGENNQTDDVTILGIDF